MLLIASRNKFMECPATLKAAGREDDGKYFSLWEPDVRLDQQYEWRCGLTAQTRSHCCTSSGCPREIREGMHYRSQCISIRPCT